MIRRVLFYFVFVILVGIWSILYASYEMLCLFIFTLLMPIILLCILIVSKKKLEISHIVPKDKVIKGEYIPIVLKINNKGLFPVILMKIEIECINELFNISTKEVFEIPTLKRGEQSFSFSIKSIYCGNIKIILKSIKLTDYMYLFTLKKDLCISKTIPVLSDIKIIECNNVPVNNAVSVDSDNYSKTHKGDDPSEVFDIREYREGDELHSIHWKLSAKKNDLIVKELSMPLSSGIVIMPEMYINGDNKNSHNNIDAIIEIIIALSLKLQECGYIHYIAWYDDISETCKRILVDENINISEVMKSIYRSRTYSSETKLINAYNAEFYDFTESHLYYITSIYNEDELEKLKNSRENAFINYIFITENDELVDDNMRINIEANDIKLQIVEYTNIDKTIESLEL